MGIAVTVAAVAAADVGVELLTTNARPGEVARLRAPARMPLYLVTASRAPKPHRCGTNAICEPSSVGPPNHWPYVRLRVLARHAGIVRFRVPPALRRGSYRAVVYCEPCYRGPRGSLIVSANALAVG
jgi:hypothetical protein